MTPEQLREIEQRWAKATPGPWQYEERENDDGMTDCHCITNGVIDYTFGYDMEEYDAIAIASAPTDIALLLAEVRRLQEENMIANEAVKIVWAEKETLKCCGNCRQQEGNPYFECAYMDVESYNESGCKRCSEWEAAGNG